MFLVWGPRDGPEGEDGAGGIEVAQDVTVDGPGDSSARWTARA
ncbi:MAG TPA: hypothetical protein VJ978_02760 [Nitriliruptoraceae bacterium]|nr:hypothetical protein [Nitriliruptoraceae bacterium]